ncbi:MAG: HAD family hydrolase [Synergistaceae bacterium]|jgi:phosphoglycolate phosphatase|nr:HAD family hydrolase [Synergistaceae bacterium]
MQIDSVKAVLFDFDMTLMDTSHIITECTNLLADRYELRRVTRDETLAVIGLPILDSWAALWGRFEDEWLDYYRTNFRGMEHNGFREFPGTRDVPARIRDAGIKTGVVSNRRFAASAVEQSGIGAYFDVVIGLEDVSNPKPHPEPILMALESLGIEPHGAVYVGDADIDMRTAVAADVIGIGVTTGNFGASELLSAGASHACASLDEIPDIVFAMRQNK